MRAIKSKGTELMGVQPGHVTLDIGCGPGIDTVPRARIVGPQGRVYGIDADPVMIEEANTEALRKGVSTWTFHHVGTATSLPFANDLFDSLYAERLYQHLYPPAVELSISEALRVTKSGGHVVAIDTDWATFSIDTNGALTQLERYLVALHTRRFANPYSGRRLFRLFREHGFSNVVQELFDIPLEATTVQVLLDVTVRQALAVGLLSPPQWRAFQELLSIRAGYGTFFAHLSMVAVCGIKR
jgi:ubiquinone/menaquinone biosynthesis C-methylase UbiE